MKASKMDFLAKMINSFQSLNSFAKSFTLDVWQGSEYASIQ